MLLPKKTKYRKQQRGRRAGLLEGPDRGRISATTG